MANQLTMADIQSILRLHARGWGNRRIARELGIDRETVAKYVRAAVCVSKPAKAPIGSEAAGGRATTGADGASTSAGSPEGQAVEAGRSGSVPEAADRDSKPAKAPIGSEPKPAKAPLGSEAVWEFGVSAGPGGEEERRSGDSAGSFSLGPIPKPWLVSRRCRQIADGQRPSSCRLSFPSAQADAARGSPRSGFLRLPSDGRVVPHGVWV
jgi:Helix-turn-helix domain